MENSSVSGESDLLSDVALAWKSLQKAKAALRRIENKFYRQTWSCAKSQAARRKLWREKGFAFEQGKGRGDECLNQKRSHVIPPTCRGGSRSAPCSPARRETADGEGATRTWSPAKSLYKPRRDNFGELADSRSHMLQKEKSPRCLHHPPHSAAGSRLFSAVPCGSWSNAPFPILLPTYSIPSTSTPTDQKLDGRWKKSPPNKLEQLKKKIQEQKQKQQAASQEQKCLISSCVKEPVQKRPLKRKVCKVASAPPAPHYRDQRKRSSAQRIQMQSQRQPSPKSSVLERPATGAKLPGVFAWREGQKLARKLLGPPPAFPNLRRRAEVLTTANTFEPDRGFVAVPAMQKSSREKGKEVVGGSPGFKSCVVPHSKPIEMGSNAPTKDTKQILRNLHLQSHEGHSQTSLPKDTVKEKVEVLQKYLGIRSPSPGSQGTTPSAFSGQKMLSSLMKAGTKPSTSGRCSRGKSMSQRQKGSSSPAQKGSEKENLKHPLKKSINIKKHHPYSSEIVQEFMYQKNEERKKKRLEEKKSLVQAMEMRNKRLQEVYRKQKEAVGKKTYSDPMCKLIRETASAKESPEFKREQEQTSAGILKSSSMAWVDKTSCTLSSKDHRGRNQLLETVQSPKKREALASAAPLESECWFLNPLKCENLRRCSPPALHTPPLSFSLPQKDAIPYSKDSTSGLSPYRSKEDRVKAIHSLSKELTEKIEMATKRLNAASSLRDFGDKTLTETTLNLYNGSPSVLEPETSEDMQNKTMTIQMLLDTPDPDVLHVSLNREYHGLDRISLVGSSEGATAPDRQEGISLPGGSAVSKEFPWVTHKTGQKHLDTGEDPRNALQGFLVNKGSELDINLLHEKPITSPASPPHRFLTGSPQRDLTAQRNHYRCETTLKIQNRQEDAIQPPRESLQTPGSLGLQPSATSSPGTETHHGFEQDLAFAGEEDQSYTDLEEKHRSHLDNLRQTSLLLAHKLKVHQCQQEQQLLVLRGKVKQEVQESQKVLSDLLQHNLEAYGSSKGSDPSVSRLDHAEQVRRGYQPKSDNAAGKYRSNQEMHLLERSALKMERDCSPVDTETVGERKPLGGRGSRCSALQEVSLPAEYQELLHDHQKLNLLPPPVNLPHEETCVGEDSGESSDPASSNSQWSEVGRHYGHSSTFCSFSLAMAEQCLRGEELRARHQDALLELRKKALQEKARAELAWLSHQKRCLESLQDSERASAMAAKQCKILTELKQEQVMLQQEKLELINSGRCLELLKQAEIQHLQNIYRAAHQERKLLLKQQRDILRMQHSTAQLEEKLHNMTGNQEHTHSATTEEVIRLNAMRLTSSPKLYHSSSSTEEAAHPERSDLSGSRASGVQLKNKQRDKYEGFSTEHKPLAQYQQEAEESPGLEQSLGGQGLDASEMVAKKVCGATSQTTSSVIMMKDCKNTELNTQGPLLSPLEQANSARMDEPISTTVTREGRKCAFLESPLEEKVFISNPETDPKDNEDINSCDGRFTRKGLEMLSTVRNLCLSHAENTPQGTVKEVEVPVPYETHQVNDSWCLKQLDHISHEASEEELNLKAFSEGLASTESSPKSNNFSPRCRSTMSDSLLPEFQIVSALWIDISESSISDSELQLKNGEDTDVSLPEEFVCDNGDAPLDVSKETLIAISTGKEMLPSNKPNEHEESKDDSSETSPHSQKHPEAVSDHSCTDNFLSFIPSDKANAFKMQSADYSQSHRPAKRMDEPHLDASGNCSRNKTCSEDITKQGAVASSSCSDDIYSLKDYEQQNLSSTTSRVERDGRVNSLFVDQNTDIMRFPLTGSLKHLDLATEQFRNTVSFPISKETTENKLLACLSAGNLSISGGKNELLTERLASSTPAPGICEAIHTEPSPLDALQRVDTGNQSNSPAERQAEEEKREQFSSVPSKKQLFQAETCASRGEEDTIFISDEGLPPADEDALLEILSPVDEVLSYGSADLPSSNKKDLSFPSEDLPPPPLGAEAMKNDDSTFSTDDFPSPPEQMIVSETRQCTDEDISLKMDVLPPLLHSNVPEGFPLLNRETTDTFSTLDSSCSEQSLVKGIPCAKEGLLEYQQGEHETPLQHLESLPVLSPVSPSQASKSPDFTMEQCKPSLMLPKAEEDSDDPLLSFKIGDRVLVKQTQPGTLMFKGQTCFDRGYWAGVALDKAEGDHAGTYKGVKYFECAQHCGIFVRPDEISHLLEATENDSNHTEDEDSDSFCGDESFKGDCKYSEYDKQGGNLPEQKAEDPKSTGGSEMKENQSRLHVALLSGKGKKLPCSDQYKCNEFLCQNNLTCLESDKEKTELTQLEQRILADVLPVKNEIGNTEEINTSKNVCCLVEDQKRNKLYQVLANELGKDLPFETLTAISAAAQHKYKNAFEKDTMNYGKGLRQDNNQKTFLLKENPIALLFEQSAKISDVLLSNSNILGIHGCRTTAERIVTKFVDDTVKEYMKIKRKHGSKADKIFHSSSETSPATLPFLIKILDAGIFGSSEDFEQPISDHHTPAKQTPKQHLYKLDQWHSAPWKKTVEVPLVIPHCSSYVKKLSARAVEQLWTPANIYSNFKRIIVPKHLGCNNLPGNDLETESKRMYNQVIFDLTHELLCAEYQASANANTFPWMKENLGSYCSRHLCRGTDVSEVKKFVQGEIIKTMNLEKNDLEMKRKFLNMTKYGNYKRDRVDIILIQELRKEESQWTCYDDDELTVKMRMTEDIFDSLIRDTIGILNKIYQRKAHD